MPQKTSHLSAEAVAAVKEGEEIRKSLVTPKKAAPAKKVEEKDAKITEASTDKTSDGVLKSEQADVKFTKEEKK